MATKKAQQPTNDDEREQFQRFHDEFATKPLDYVRHDADARKDESLRRAVAEHGMGFLGAWWVLVELLCSKDNHRYDVTDHTGWQLFALDMSTCGRMWTVDECRDFCDQLAEYGLIDRELYDRGKVVNNRVCREVDAYANAAAGKKLGNWKTNRGRWEVAGR